MTTQNESTTTIPANAKKLDHLILADGEVTGHAHRAATGTLYEVGGALVLDAPENTPITHEEHRVLAPPARESDVSRVREYDHAAEEARPVSD